MTAILAVLVVAVGGGAAAWINADRAASWQAAAIDLRDERDTTAKELEVTRLDLAENAEALKQETAKLTQARARLDDLDGRVRTLANEKAAVEDEREVAQQMADVMGDLATEASQVGAGLDECITRMTSWLADTPNEYSTAGYWNSWVVEGEGVQSYCGEARSAFDTLRARLGV